jgi:heme/copper-type cytochrome/quinol oxidase subunit 4
MNWIFWLGLAVLLTAIAAITGIKPKGTRHVAHSRMMGMGRVFLVILVAIFAYMAYRARSGG